VNRNDKDAFPTIADAVAGAQDGDRILVVPGDYPEHLLLNKAVEISGTTEAEDVRITGTSSKPIVIASGAPVRLHNLSLINEPKDKSLSESIGITIHAIAGILEIEHCVILGGRHCLSAEAGTRISVDASFLRGARLNGLHAENCASLNLVDSLIDRCGSCGIVADGGDHLLIRHCTISSSATYGLMASGDGYFEVIDTEFSNNVIGSIFDNQQIVNSETPRFWYVRQN
jgi:hypothetical protein